MLRHLGPAVYRDIDQRFPPCHIVEILLRKNGELRSDGIAAQFCSDIGEGFKPVYVVAPHFNIRMAKMIEPTIRTGHTRCHAHAGFLQGLLHQACHAVDGGSGPAGINKFMGQLQITDADLLCHGVNQILRIGKAIHQRVGIQRKR